MKSGRTLFALAVLAAGNVYLANELFTLEYSRYQFSIECTHITIARWIAEHAGELGWFPLWYGGTPFHMTYPPLSGALAAAGIAWFGASPALAYHATTATLYCLGPLTLFWLAFTLSGKRSVAFVAAAIYTVLSPAAFFMPDVARDLQFHFGGRRLQALIPYGEGPHIASLMLIPIGLVALHYAIRRRTVLAIWLASLAVAAVVLSNWIGTVAFAVAVLALLMSSLEGDWLRTMAISAAVGTLAYAIASPWIPPSNVLWVRRNAQYVVGSYPVGAPQYLYLGSLAILSVLLFWVLHRLRAGQLVRFAALYFLWIGGISVSREWFGVYAIPQPERYHLEMELAFALLAGAAIVAYIRWVGVRTRRLTLPGVLIILLAAGIYYQGKQTRRFVRSLLQPADITQTVEYEIAGWLRSNMPGGRVLATGSTHFWLNVFSDQPQLSGAADQAVVNPVLPDIWFGVPFSRGTGDQSAAWLRAYGVDAVVTGGKRSRDQYRDFRDPGKFNGILPLLWRDGDDRIYGVPRRSTSLARVIPAGAELAVPPPDIWHSEALAAFVGTLEDPSLPAASLQWENPQTVLVTGEVSSGQNLYIQITWHPGWRAEVNGKPRPVRADGLGQMIVEPGCDGPCTVRLSWTGGLEMTLARTACGLALLIPPLIALGRKRFRWQAT